MNVIPRRVAETLKFYVYLYIDPRDGVVFYVGKGTGARALAHLKGLGETEKVERIAELRQLGKEPEIEILRYGLTENEAFLIECTAIELLGLDRLTNRVKGHHAAEKGRGRLEDIVRELDAREVRIRHPMLLINISRLYTYGMSRLELYDATRSAWRIGERRHVAEYAAAVYAGIIREVYRIAAWVPGGTTMNALGDRRDGVDPTRLEFVGDVADETIRRRYVGRSVREHLPPGMQNPIRYVNC
jgi:uncharacterized protein